MITRRQFLKWGAAGTFAAAAPPMRRAFAFDEPPRHVLLRSSWQTINIGDIAHTPGMLTLLERHLPATRVTLWPNRLSEEVAAMLRQRFPKLAIAATAEEQEKALAECDFGLHGSGPGLVGWREMERWRETGKPYGFGGVTLSDNELRDRRELLASARFVFCRDTLSLDALKETGIGGPVMEFGPDATFHLDLRDEERAAEFLREHGLAEKKFAGFVPRLRWTPYWKEGRRMAPEEISRRQTENERHCEADHAKLRAAIVAWVRETGHKALLCPEMTYQVELLRPLLFNPLPDDVQPRVVVRSDYWLTDEAASTYARAAAVVSFEMHSPIIALFRRSLRPIEPRGRSRDAITGIGSSRAAVLLSLHSVQLLLQRVLNVSLNEGVPGVINGQRVLHSHGKVIRRLTPAEYRQHHAYVLRAFSGHWMFFYLASAAMLTATTCRSSEQTNSNGDDGADHSRLD